MKKSRLIIGLLTAALLISGCSGNSGEQTTGEPTTTEPVPSPVDPLVDEEYSVIVKSPAAVTYTLNKQKAKFNEEIVLTITSVSSSFSIKDVRLNGALLTAETDGVTYKFSMPNRSASIIIRVSVEGDVVTDGDFAVAFNEVSPDIFEATAAVPAEIGNTAKFNVVIGDVKLRTTDLDYSTSFGDISCILGRHSDYSYEVATGSTYKLIYDTNKNEMPLSIKRVSVQVLPQSPDALASILVDGYAIFSEPAMFVDDLIGISYDSLDKTVELSSYHHNYSWNKFSDDKTFAKVYDVDDPDNEMYIYRSYDRANKTYTVVDSYPLKVGSLTVNDYRYREGYNAYGAYSARYDVIEGDDYGHRFAQTDWKVVRDLNCSAHQPAYLLEHEIWYSYRHSGLASLSITSEAISGGFKTSIDSCFESTTGEAVVYDADFTFDVRGAVKTLLYKEVRYTDAQWDTSTHAPKSHQIGYTQRRINATYTYGEATTAFDPSEFGFDVSDYFISSIDTYKYVNSKLATYATNDDSYIGFEDPLFIEDNEGNRPSAVTYHCTPETALDTWQYGPVASSDTNVIAKQPTDLYYQMTPTNEGTATVTFSNHVEAPSIQGATIDVVVHVIATESIRSFYFDQVWNDRSYSQHNSWHEAIVYANGHYKFRLNSSPSAAPVVYHAVSSDPSKLTITSPDNSRDLVIDTTGANGITENVMVNITFESGRYDSTSSPTVFNIYIMPAQASPIGTWKSMDYDSYAYFTEEAYGDSLIYFKGYITDHYIDTEGVDHGTDTFYFYYSYNGAYIDAYIYAMDIQTGSTPSVSDMYLEFSYSPSNGHYGIFLAETETEDDIVYYNPILGVVDETYTIIKGGAEFVKIA